MSVLTFAAIVWLLLLPRMIPSVRADRGVFVSVAERLIAGDTLYAVVWDNKDPLFFYSLAVARWLTPYGDIALEILWMLLAATAVWLIARSTGCNGSRSLAIAFVVTPIVLTGTFYYPGYSHLPGTALALIAFAAALYQRFLLAGLLLATLIFMKITSAPIAFAVIFVVIAMRRQWRQLFLVLFGLVFGIAFVAALLAVRGELVPYLKSIALNLSYSSDALSDTDWIPMVARLVRVANTSSVVVILVCVTILIIGLSVKRVSFVPLRNRDDWTVWMAIAASLFTSVLVLSATGLWDHHNQVLYVPALLSLVALASWSRAVSPLQPFLAMVALSFISLLIAGANPIGVLRSYSQLPTVIADLGRVPPEAEALLSLAGPSGSYARLGSNDDRGHAFGLSEWKLGCPRFHLYPSLSQQILDESLKCLRTVDAIIVSPASSPLLGLEGTNADPWSKFWPEASAVLSSDFECASRDDVTICTRKGT